jgi:hypothetical protein
VIISFPAPPIIFSIPFTISVSPPAIFTCQESFVALPTNVLVAATLKSTVILFEEANLE